MSMVRFLPRQVPRSTGISRAQAAPGRPTTAVHGSSSPVGAAPGVTPQVQQHVASARNPGGATPQPRRQAELLNAGERPLPQPRQVPGAPGHRQGQVQVVGPGQVQPQAARPTSPFTVDQSMLVGYLLGEYEKRMRAEGDDPNAQLARGALHGLRQAMQASAGRPMTQTVTAGPQPRHPTGAVYSAGVPGQVPGVQVPAGAHPRVAQAIQASRPIPAHTTTEILGRWTPSGGQATRVTPPEAHVGSTVEVTAGDSGEALHGGADHQADGDARAVEG